MECANQIPAIDGNEFYGFFGILFRDDSSLFFKMDNGSSHLSLMNGGSFSVDNSTILIDKNYFIENFPRTALYKRICPSFDKDLNKFCLTFKDLATKEVFYYNYYILEQAEYKAYKWALQFFESAVKHNKIFKLIASKPTLRREMLDFLIKAYNKCMRCTHGLWVKPNNP